MALGFVLSNRILNDFVNRLPNIDNKRDTRELQVRPLHAPLSAMTKIHYISYSQIWEASTNRNRHPLHSPPLRHDKHLQTGTASDCQPLSKEIITCSLKLFQCQRWEMFGNKLNFRQLTTNKHNFCLSLKSVFRQITTKPVSLPDKCWEMLTNTKLTKSIKLLIRLFHTVAWSVLSPWQWPLQEVTQRILEAVGGVAGSSLEQTSWLSRNLEVKAQPQVCLQEDDDDPEDNDLYGNHGNSFNSV